MKTSPILTVDIYSFSYKQSIPGREKPHGGGFYFDCRCLPNPGREAAYKDLTGLDTAVIEYLENLPELEPFWNAALQLVLQAVDNYRARGFESLVVGFGCTGGQHRSVYFAERLSRELAGQQGVTTTITHCQQPVWPHGRGKVSS